MSIDIIERNVDYFQSPQFGQPNQNGQPKYYELNSYERIQKPVDDIYTDKSQKTDNSQNTSLNQQNNIQMVDDNLSNSNQSSQTEDKTRSSKQHSNQKFANSKTNHINQKLPLDIKQQNSNSLQKSQNIQNPYARQNKRQLKQSSERSLKESCQSLDYNMASHNYQQVEDFYKGYENNINNNKLFSYESETLKLDKSNNPSSDFNSTSGLIQGKQDNNTQKKNIFNGYQNSDSKDKQSSSGKENKVSFTKKVQIKLPSSYIILSKFSPRVFDKQKQSNDMSPSTQAERVPSVQFSQKYRVQDAHHTADIIFKSDNTNTLQRQVQQQEGKQAQVDSSSLSADNIKPKTSTLDSTYHSLQEELSKLKSQSLKTSPPTQPHPPKKQVKIYQVNTQPQPELEHELAQMSPNSLGLNRSKSQPHLNKTRSNKLQLGPSLTEEHFTDLQSFSPRTSGDLLQNSPGTMPLTFAERRDPTFYKFGAMLAYLLPDATQLRKNVCSVNSISTSWSKALRGCIGSFRFQEKGRNDWKRGWFDLFGDSGLMAWVSLFGVAVNARNMAGMVGGSYEDHFYNSIQSLCCYSCYHARVRTEYRERYNIKGSAMNDTALSIFCLLCVVMQESRELSKHTPYAIPFTKVGDSQALLPKPPLRQHGDFQRLQSMHSYDDLTSNKSYQEGLQLCPPSQAQSFKAQ